MVTKLFRGGGEAERGGVEAEFVTSDKKGATLSLKTSNRASVLLSNASAAVKTVASGVRSIVATDFTSKVTTAKEPPSVEMPVSKRQVGQKNLLDPKDCAKAALEKLPAQQVIEALDELEYKERIFQNPEDRQKLAEFRKCVAQSSDDKSSDDKSIRVAIGNLSNSADNPTFLEEDEIPSTHSSESILPSSSSSDSVVTENSVKKPIFELSEDAQKIRHLLIGLLKRPEVSYVTEGNVTRTQNQGCTYSAEGQKTKGFPDNKLANRRVVVDINLDNTHELLFVASSRSDNESRVGEKSQMAIEAAIQAGDTNIIGIDGVIKRLDITNMDQSFKKAVGTTISSFIEGQASENESKFFSNKETAVSDLFPDGVRKHEIDGKTYFETKPLVCNYVFSGEAKSASNVQTAHDVNVQHSEELFKDYFKSYAKKLEKIENEPTKALLQDQLKNLSEVLKNDPKLLVGELDKSIKLLQDAAVDNKDIKTVIAHLQSMRILITGTDVPGATYTPAQQSLKEFLAMTMLGRAAGYVISLECKSGNDRTLVSASLVCAQKDFQTKYGYPFTDLSNEVELQNFKNFFTQAFINLGPSNLEYSRGLMENGKPGVKVGKSPIFNYLIPKGSAEREIIEGNEEKGIEGYLNILK